MIDQLALKDFNLVRRTVCRYFGVSFSLGKRESAKKLFAKHVSFYLYVTALNYCRKDACYAFNYHRSQFDYILFKIEDMRDDLGFDSLLEDLQKDILDEKSRRSSS